MSFAAGLPLLALLVAMEPANIRIGPCGVTSRSDLPGVSIIFSATDCEWTLSEARAGLHVDYIIRIEHDIEGIIPVPLDAGRCDEPHSSGLAFQAVLEGGGQRYCRCDVGLCAEPADEPVTLRAGFYSGRFEWDGLNWGGPSDTGRPKGPPFPPGLYTLTIRAAGRWKRQDGEAPFNVAGSLKILLR